jgi:hypothetical protein
MEEQAEKESLLTAYKVPGFRAQARVDVYEIKDRPALAITLERRQKKRCALTAARRITAFTTRDGFAPATLIAERTRSVWISSIGAWHAGSAAA